MASPTLNAIVAMLRALPPRPTGMDGIHNVRMLLDTMAQPASAETEVIRVSASGVPCEWVLAPGCDADARLLYLHGGGYVAGSCQSHRSLAAHIAAASRHAVLLAEYRLAPEHPHPAAVDDAVAAFRWMRGHGPRSEGRARRTAMAGDSAGGGLTLATLLTLRDAGDALPDAAVTLAAWTDLAATGESLTSRASVDPMVDPAELKTFAALYAGARSPRDPLVSPLHADLGRLPPLLMQVGDAEVLLDDTTRVAKKAKDAGTDVTMEVWPEMIHVWQAWANALPEATDAIERIGAFLRSREARSE